MAFEISKLTRLYLGYVGENESRIIDIDVSDWLDQWPDAIIAMTVQRPQEKNTYIPVTEVKGSILSWTVRREDVAIAGNGMAQIRALQAHTGRVYMSRVVPTVIASSMTGEVDDGAPPPETGWVNTVLLAAADAQQSEDDAKGHADRAEAAVADLEQTAAAETQKAVAAIQAKGEETLATIPDDYTDLSNSVSQLSEENAKLDKQIEQVENNFYSNEYITPVLRYTAGMILKSNGQIVSSGYYQYSQAMPVSEGDIIRYKGYASEAVLAIACYASTDLTTAIIDKSISGSEKTPIPENTFMVPAGVDYIRFCVNASQADNCYIRIKKPFYDRVITDGFDVLAGQDPMVGVYYASGTSLIFNGSGAYANYKCYKANVTPGHYAVDGMTKFAVGTDDNDVVTYYSGNVSKNDFELPAGTTRLYATYDPSAYPDGIRIAKGYEVYAGPSKQTYDWLQPNFVDRTIRGVSIANRVYCSMPDTVYMDTSNPIKIYIKNILAQSGSHFWCNSVPGLETFVNDKYLQVTCLTSGAYTMQWAVYDSNLQMIQTGQTVFVVSALSGLTDATGLIIGDSFAAYGGLSSVLRDQFANYGKTLTLIGTRGTAPNLHEGRGGWSAKAYCTSGAIGSFTNPFYNDGKFDFRYYIEQNNFSTPDFVVINLGINAVFSLQFANYATNAAEEIEYYHAIIDSIHDYDPAIKVYCCLPTPPNTQNGKFSEAYGTTQMLWMYSNNIKHYAHDLAKGISDTANAFVVQTNCVLDTNTDIGDGVHPVTAGVEKLMHCVMDAIAGT